MKVEFSKIVDLSHEIFENMPTWTGDPKTEIVEFESGEYIIEKLTLSTHSGTHVGTSKHFKFSESVSDLEPENLFVKSVLIDVSKSRCDLSVEEIERWQERHGKIVEKCVILRTAQEFLWGDEKRYFEEYPGFSVDAVKYLLRAGVRIFATDAPSIDPSHDRHFLSNLELFKGGGIHVENLVNLSVLPVRGFWIFIAPLKLDSGGSPARVVAFV